MHALRRGWRIGVGAAVDVRCDAVVIEEWIAEACSTNARSGRLALLHRVDAAALYAIDVQAAKLVGARCGWRKHAPSATAAVNVAAEIVGALNIFLIVCSPFSMWSNTLRGSCSRWPLFDRYDVIDASEALQIVASASQIGQLDRWPFGRTVPKSQSPGNGTAAPAPAPGPAAYRQER